MVEWFLKPSDIERHYCEAAILLTCGMTTVISGMLDAAYELMVELVSISQVKKDVSKSSDIEAKAFLEHIL